MKKTILIVLATILVLCSAMPLSANASANNSPSRQINVVYDDSGSMYNTSDGTHVDTWCRAKYSMEVFAAMLGDKDKMNVYYMHDYESGLSASPRLKLDGKDGAATNVAKVHSAKTEAHKTPFNSVRKAYNDLKASNADEKWLVILTDGAFQQLPEGGMDSFFNQIDDGIGVIFLGIGDNVPGITPKPSKNIYCFTAENSTKILQHITTICTIIFESDRLDVNISSKRFSFDVPMGELIVFAQGANVNINGIKTESGTLIKSSREPVEVKNSECDATNKHNEPVRDLAGSIAIFFDDFVPGNYSVDVTGAETVEVYYKPNIDIAVSLTDSSGMEVMGLSEIEAGEYTLNMFFVKGGTNERVNSSSLLGDVSFDAVVTSNGVNLDHAFRSGDKINVEEGSLTIDVTAEYLTYNSLSSVKNFSVYKDNHVSFSVKDNPSYIVYSDGFDSDKYILVSVKINGETPTKEQWEIMDTPVAQLSNEYRDFRLDSLVVEKTAEPGVLRIYPKLPGGKPTTGTYRDTVYTLSLNQTTGKVKWIGSMEDTLKLSDTRSWFERNWDLFVKLAILIAILIFLAGYLPIFKHYLPKALKKKPYIKCVPGKPGEKRKDRNGLMEKNLISTIIPYVAQTGTIKVVPKGVTGAPALKVRGIRRRRMSITNIRAYQGKDYITFDGESIKKDCTKFETGAGLTVKVKKNDWTYTCTLNQ